MSERNREMAFCLTKSKAYHITNHSQKVFWTCKCIYFHLFFNRT